MYIYIYIQNLSVATDVYEACKDAHAVILITEWRCLSLSLSLSLSVCVCVCVCVLLNTSYYVSLTSVLHFRRFKALDFQHFLYEFTRPMYLYLY